MHQNPVARALGAIKVGKVLVVENLLMFPLLRAGSDLDSQDARESGSDPDRGRYHDLSRRRTLDYTILDDALNSGTIEITEVSAQGSVPELLVVNRGPKPVLIIDGEELTGAKQNRVVNLTILVPAASTLTIPVSCVEVGRWRARSKSFAAAPRTQYATGRAMRMEQVTRSIVDRGERLSDQSAVWADIADKSARMEATSATSAMDQIFTQHAESLDAYVSGCIPVDGQCGALFAIVDRTAVAEAAERRPRIVGFDLFDSAQTFRQLLPKLVRSYAVDAIDSNGPDVSLRSKRDRRTKVPDSPEAAESSYSRGFRLPRPERANASRRQEALAHIVPGFLGALAAATQRCARAVGMGDDVRLTASGLVGAALLVGDEVVHVSGFSV